jgi:hypothetical protein
LVGRAAAGRLDVGLEVGDGGLHRLGRLQHEGQLHLPGGEQLTDRGHAGQQEAVDDVQRGCSVERLVEVGVDAVLVAVDDAALEPLLDRQRGELLGGRAGLPLPSNRRISSCSGS